MSAVKDKIPLSFYVQPAYHEPIPKRKKEAKMATKSKKSVTKKKAPAKSKTKAKSKVKSK